MKIKQEPIREKQLQEKFLDEQSHSLSQNSHPDHKFSSHGLRNFQNHWGSSGGVRWGIGVGLLQEAETRGKRDPVPREEVTLTLNSWSVVTGSGMTRGQIGNLVIVNQTFGLSQNQSSGILEQVPYDGLLGLAYPSLAVRGTTPVFDNLKNQRVISEPVFAFYLSSQPGNSSVVMFGGVDHTYHKGKIQWVPVTRTSFWQVAMSSISINGNVVGCSQGCQAIVDTGTSSLVGPTHLVTNILKLINPKPILDDKISQEICFSSFQGGTELLNPSETSETWILGDVFLRLYFSVYDRGNNRIGLAPAA
ncbi:PAG2, partial [Cervus elaphus hippelaphus]